MSITAEEYLRKCHEICKQYDGKGGCEECLLDRYSCGLPDEPEKILECVELIEHYEENNFPFGRCKNCGTEFNSELINEYGMTHCLKCGFKIEK